MVEARAAGAGISLGNSSAEAEDAANGVAAAPVAAAAESFRKFRRDVFGGWSLVKAIPPISQESRRHPQAVAGN